MRENEVRHVESSDVAEPGGNAKSDGAAGPGNAAELDAAAESHGTAGPGNAAELDGAAGAGNAAEPDAAAGAGNAAIPDAAADESDAVKLGAAAQPSDAATPSDPAQSDATAKQDDTPESDAGAVTWQAKIHAPCVRDIDVIYRETDRLYYEFARDCGLSTIAFWSLVKVITDGGSTTQAQIADEYSFSRQSVNSAIKGLEAKGLVRVANERGKGRRKAVSLTEAGTAFCAQHITPAVDAERRAFETLPPQDRDEFVRIVRAYTDAIDAELGRLANDTQPNEQAGSPHTTSASQEGDRS